MGQSLWFCVLELPWDQAEAGLPLERYLCLAPSTVCLASLTPLLSSGSTASINFLQESLSQALPQENPTEDRHRGK